MHAYSDADWAGNRDDRTSGLYCFSWWQCYFLELSQAVARSSTEAEYRAVAASAAELAWVLLGELGISITKPPVIYCDNIGATYLCANPVFHSRMKHIAIDYHFVRDKVSSGLLQVSHVSTKVADALTKSLSRLTLKVKDWCLQWEHHLGA